MVQDAGKLIERIEDGTKQFYEVGYGLPPQELDEIHGKIGKLDVKFIEHGKYLYIVKGHGCKGFEMNILKKLKDRNSITVLRFYRLNEDTIRKKDTFDFSEKTNELIIKYLPNLEEVSVNNMGVSKFQLRNIQSIVKVTLDVPFFQDPKFSLKLPNLKALEMWYPPIKDPSQLEESLINCPRLEKFYCRRPNCEENPDYAPTFYLPNCLEFSLLVSETIKDFKMYAPRLKKLDLSASHIDLFQILENGNEEMKEYNLPNDIPQSKFQLSMPRGLFGATVKHYLKAHPRNDKNYSDDYNNNDGSLLPNKGGNDTNNNINPQNKKRKQSTNNAKDKRVKPRVVERKTISGRVFTF